MITFQANPPSGGMSVIIPTYNRADCLCKTLEACGRAARGLPIEFIVIDDGSADDTPDRLRAMQNRLPNLCWQRVANGGPGQARNLGASLARNDLILFLGDDIRPRGEDFFRAHLEVHQQFPRVNSAALGKVVWPSDPREQVNFVMQHIQGSGAEQFGYYHMMPHSWLDYRYFYTCNVSVKRRLVSDWMSEGFSKAFPLAGFEDIEFAYRMQARHPDFGIYYTPLAVAEHFHHYSLEKFMRRQFAAGQMLKVFLELHRDVPIPGAAEFVAVINSEKQVNDAQLRADAALAVEGIKALARLVDHTQKLGTQNWHADLLTAIFRLCFDEGFLAALDSPDNNIAAGYLLALARFRDSLGRAMHRELFGRHALTELLVGHDTSPVVKRGRLRQTLARVPGLRPAYRAARRAMSRVG